MSRAHVRGMVKKRKSGRWKEKKEYVYRRRGKREEGEREKGKAVYIYARACDLSARA